MSELRRAVRVLLIDPAGRTLLLFHSKPHDEDHWAPPGGGLDPGESLEQAGRRELREELGLTDVELTAPSWEWRHTFGFDGAQVDQHEAYFVVRVGQTPAGPPPGEWERDGIRSLRWWSAAELAATTEQVWPAGLASWLAELTA